MKLRRLFLLCAVGHPLALSAQASAYVPLDDIAYTYVNALMARGMFRELSVLERPFTGVRQGRLIPPPREPGGEYEPPISRPPVQRIPV